MIDPADPMPFAGSPVDHTPQLCALHDSDEETYPVFIHAPVADLNAATMPLLSSAPVNGLH